MLYNITITSLIPKKGIQVLFKYFVVYYCRNEILSYNNKKIDPFVLWKRVFLILTKAYSFIWLFQISLLP